MFCFLLLLFFGTPFSVSIIERRRTFVLPEGLVFPVYKNKRRSHNQNSSRSDLSFYSPGIPWWLWFNVSVHIMFLLRSQLINTIIVYTKFFDLVALHHSQFDWLNNENDFLLNRCSMALSLFLFYQHKERLCKCRSCGYFSLRSSWWSNVNVDKKLHTIRRHCNTK